MSDLGTDGLPSVLYAVVLDTNAMPNGIFSAAHLHELADILTALAHPAELWIPEPVLWEWAEHRHSSRAAAAKRLSEAQSAAFRCGLLPERCPPIPDVPTVEVVLSEIWRDCKYKDNIRVVELSTSPDVAIAGMRDQILQLGVGRRKSAGDGKRVKTGAADSATFRLIAECARGIGLENIILVSNDADARQHFAAPAKAPRIISTLWHLKHELALETELDAVFRDEIELAIRKELISPSHWPRNTPSIEGDDRPFASGIDRPYLTTRVDVRSIDRVVSVSEIGVTRHSRWGTAVVRAEIALELVGNYWNDVDDELEEETTSAWDIGADLQVSLERLGEFWTVDIDHIVVRENSMHN